MIDLSEKNIAKLADETGFITNNLEKAIRLMDILENIFSSKWKGKLVLKGGTAINLFYQRMPRLSVDIDLDYIGGSRDEMLEDKEKLWRFLSSEFARKGYFLSERSTRRFALDSAYLQYVNNAGNQDKIKIDINYMDRVHVLLIQEKFISLPHLDIAEMIPVKVLEPSELYGSKFSALLNRCKPRDIYDAYRLTLDDAMIDRPLLRKCAIFYNCVGGEANIDDALFEILDGVTENKVFRELRPFLSRREKFSRPDAIIAVKKYLKALFVLTEEEKTFVREFRKGNYIPELLFDDDEIIQRIKNHPMVMWRTR